MNYIGKRSNSELGDLIMVAENIVLEQYTIRVMSYMTSRLVANFLKLFFLNILNLNRFLKL